MHFNRPTGTPTLIKYCWISAMLFAAVGFSSLFSFPKNFYRSPAGETTSWLAKGKELSYRFASKNSTPSADDFFEDTKWLHSEKSAFPAIGFTGKEVLAFFDTNIDPETRMVVFLGHIYISSVEFRVYEVQTRNLVFSYKTGLSSSVADPEIGSTGYAVKIPSLGPGLYRIGIVAKSKYPISLPVFWGSEVSFLKVDAIKEKFLWCYLGLIFALIMYNFFVFLSVRDSVYLYYVLTLIGLHFFANLSQFGWTRNNVLTNVPWFHKNVFHIAHFVSLAPMLLFGGRFMEIRRRNPKIFFSLVTVTLVTSILMSIGLVTDSLFVDMGQQFCATIFLLGLWMVSILQSLSKFRQPKFFLAAWTILILSWVFNFLRIDGFNAESPVIEFSILFGAALEGIILSLALADRLNTLRDEKNAVIKKNLRLETVATLASQVSHDIRSPLAALEMVLKDVASLPEEQRVLVRSATARIRDIANGLLNTEKTNRVTEAREPTSPQLLVALVDLIITEKRVQFRAKKEVEIEAKVASQAFGLFASVSGIDFKRVLSNLINNSVEAMDKGQVVVHLRKGGSDVLVEVQDNGRGIPRDLLDRLGQERLTQGKSGTESGSGLGVLHAKQCVETWGGLLEIRSELGKGSTFTLRIPLADQPAWFPGEIALAPSEFPVVVDDDLTILHVWEGRFGSEGFRSLKHFTGAASFSSWYDAEGKNGNFKFLFDYELLGSERTGLDLIEQYNLAAQSVLVTSRFEEHSIRERCERLGVKLLPKGLAAFVPVRVRSECAAVIDAVYLDDDALMRKAWEFAAVKKKKTLLCFATSVELFGRLAEIPKNTVFYIDSNLEGEHAKGEDVAKQLYERGFGNIFLATGYSASRFEGMPWIKGVVGKEAPWV